MNRNWIYGLSLLGLGLGGIGCDVKQAEAPQERVEAVKFKEFNLPAPKDTIMLTSNQLFLWPDKVSEAVATRVFDISQEIDRNEKDRITLEARQKVLHSDPIVEESNEKIKAKKRDLNTTSGQITKIKANLGTQRRKLAKLETELTTELARVPQDSTKVSELQKQVNDYNAQIKDLEEVQIPRLEAERDKAQQSLDQLVLGLNTILQSNQTELDRVSGEIERVDKLGKSLIDEVMTLADPWYDMSQSRVSFKTKEDGSLSISISHWILDDKGNFRDFSSEPNLNAKPTIQNIKYDKLGGIIDFDVIVYEDEMKQDKITETFSFHISRNNYQAGEEKFCFQGDLYRKRTLPNGQVDVRKGVAKLIDSNG